MITWSQWIAANCKGARLTQKQLADEVGVHEKTVSLWVRGKHRPDMYSRGKLAELFGEMPG